MTPSDVPMLFDEQAPAPCEGSASVVALGAEVRWSVGEQRTRPHSVWTGSNGLIAAWDVPGLRIEIEVVELPRELPPGMRIDGFRVGFWRLRAFEDVLLPRLSCDVRMAGIDLGSGGSPGEYLTAGVWDHDGNQWAVGTADEEVLAWRSERNEGLPSWWAPRLREAENALGGIVELTRTDFGESVSIQLPKLMAGEEARVHHAAAWCGSTDEEDFSTWFAVDIEPLDRVYPGRSR